MKVILDELDEVEFFEHGGIVTLKNGKKIRDYKHLAFFLENDAEKGIEEANIGIDSYRYYHDKNEFHYLKLEERTNVKDPYGIPNVCFSLIDNTDDRWEEFSKERKERGFDSSELWSLDYSISKFILPRLKAFKEDTCGYPGSLSEQEWDTILGKMIMAFEVIVNDEHEDDSQDKLVEGLDLFNEYFFDLWY